MYWIVTAKDDLDAFPEDMKDVMGYALEQAQRGLKHRKATPLKGFGGAAVVEIADDYDSDTYRAVYTVKLQSGIYVLHCWQKKSTRDIERIRARLSSGGRAARAAIERARNGRVTRSGSSGARSRW